jgi:transposase
MAQPATPEIVRLSAADLERLLGELRALLPAPTYQLVESLLRTLQWVLALLEEKTATLARIRRLVGGKQSEKSSGILPKAPAQEASGQLKSKSKPKGHGRRAAGDYPGASLIKVPHPQHHVGDLCPKCLRGLLYLFKTPARIVHIVAQPFLSATVFELERLRCALCGALFTAPPPPEAGIAKYDPSVGFMLALMRFGAGLPMYRLAKWQHYFGVPVAAATQWGLIAAAAVLPERVFRALVRAAAQGQLLHHDDTYMRVQSLRREIQAQLETEDPDARTGIFTTAILARVGPVRIALFFTGRQHAGENLQEVLRQRAAELTQPLVMCDALARNVPQELAVMLANCLAHARRQYVDQIENFPAECTHVLESLGKVYRLEEQAREQQLSEVERLAFHQEHSRPVMDGLQKWMQEQLDQKRVEPNSNLGKAFNYMLKRWERLTRFLSVPGAPLDNNVTEQALKTAILHRKNSLSYKTANGARIGDIFMSLIHTCALNQVNPFDYFLTLERHAEAVKKTPADWFPWNYHLAVAAAADTG